MYKKGENTRRKLVKSTKQTRQNMGEAGPAGRTTKRRQREERKDMTTSSTTNNTKTWIGILVLAFANTAAAGAEWCSAALTTIANNFPDTPYWVITLINNVPNLCAVFCTLLAGMLVNRVVPLKTMILFGVAFHCIGGVLPVFLGESIYLVLLSRVVFGVGYGVMQGICVSMTFKLITNERLRDHAIGWSVSAQYAMNMFAQIAVGYLVMIQWNYSFFIYLWSVIPFIIVAIFCPKFPLDKNDRSAIGGEESIANETLGQTLKALPPVVWIFSIIVALYMVCNMGSIFLNLSNIIQTKLGYDPSSIGYAMTFYSISTIVGGLIYGIMVKYTKHFTLFIASVITGVGILMFATAPNYVMVCVALFVAGLGGTMIIPACQSVYGHYVPKHRAFVASSVSMCCVNIGAFMSTPYIAVFTNNPTGSLVPSAVIMFILGIVSIKFWKDTAKLEVVN